MPRAQPLDLTPLFIEIGQHRADIERLTTPHIRRAMDADQHRDALDTARNGERNARERLAKLTHRRIAAEQAALNEIFASATERAPPGFAAAQL